MTPEQMGRVAFEAYSDYRKGFTYDGKPIPAWDDLGNDVCAAWVTAARAVMERIFGMTTEEWMEAFKDLPRTHGDAT